jgi:hypothetical protein
LILSSNINKSIKDTQLDALLREEKQKVELIDAKLVADKITISAELGVNSKSAV